MSGLSKSISGARLLLVVPAATSFLTFFTGVTQEWLRRGGLVAVATGPDLPGHVPTRGQGAWPDGVERLPLPTFRGTSPLSLGLAARQLASAIRTWRPDIVHAHFAPAVCAAAIARSFCATRPAFWIGTFHGLHAAGPGGAGCRLAAAVERWSAGRMTQVWLLNAEDRTALAPRVACPVLVHDSCGVGCDLAHFDGTRFTNAERERIRRSVGVASGAFVLAFVGRQTAFKGFPAVVRGHRLLADGGLGHALLTVGEPDRLHGCGLSAAERGELERDSGVIRTGWQWDVAPWLAIADACVLPSVREGVPVSLMEALAMGVPAITSDSRGCRDVVRHGVDGLVLPAPTPEAIAGAVTRLAADRQLLDAMRAAAREGRERFDRRRFVAEQTEIYARLLGGGGDAAQTPSQSPPEPAVPVASALGSEPVQ